MPGRRSDATDQWLLVAATAILTLTLQRYFQADARRDPQLLHPPQPSRSADIVQRGRERRARTPLQIPFAGWKAILRRTYTRINNDRLLATAAGVVFFGLLAVFPAITALVSCYGLFANPSTIGDNLQTLALMLPDGSFQVVQDQIARVLAKGNTALGATFLFGLVLAIWSANTGVKAVIDALNVVYEEREKRGFVRLNLIALAFTTGGIAALLLMVSAVVALPLLLDHIGLEPESQTIISVTRWPLLLVILLIALALLYRFGPSRPPTRRQWLNLGTLVAALLWIAGSSLLSWYLSNFANYSATYGSLGAAIGLMMWMWMSAIIVLCGAELNSEIERQNTLEGAIGGPEARDDRGAVAADTREAAVPVVPKEH
jgi:membrane protein